MDFGQGSLSPTFYAQLFTHTDPKSIKEYSQGVSVFFALLESARVKAAHKLVESIPGRRCRRSPRRCGCSCDLDKGRPIFDG